MLQHEPFGISAVDHNKPNLRCYVHTYARHMKNGRKLTEDTLSPKALRYTLKNKNAKIMLSKRAKRKCKYYAVAVQNANHRTNT